MTDSVTRSEQGFTVDAQLLGSAFGIEPARVPDLMRRNEITSRSETGVEEDAGLHRLTFYFRNRALRLTVDDAGTIVKRATFDAPR